MEQTSQDAARHASTSRHHGERSKEERLDRRDGTGRGHETEKKQGGGAHNWGRPTDDAEVAREEVEGEAGPDTVSPQDFVDAQGVLTLEEFEARQAT